MKLVAAIPMYNEEIHIDMQMKNLFEADCFDQIFILDDGSTDGTWDLLNEYKKKNNNIHLIKNEINSISGHTENRWKTLLDVVVKSDPTWIQIRAADVIYSQQFGINIRSRLEDLIKDDCYFVRTPYLDLWRSNTWYRVDTIYGKVSKTHLYTTMFRYDKHNYSWSEKHCKTGWHQGYVFPTSMLGLKSCKINISERKNFEIVALHYGFSSHEKIVNRFRKHLKIADAASEINRSFRMPNSSNLPPVSSWMSEDLCGYKGFCEFNLKLNKVDKKWFKDDYIDEPQPVIESLYGVIKEYSLERAEEYKILYKKTFNKGT